MQSTTRILAALAAFPLLGLLTGHAASEELLGGKIEYRNSCAVCHGLRGEGNGPMADELVRRPADLTRLAQKNGGVFPYNRVFATIDGRYLVPSHGGSDMPVWGRQFLADDTETFGESAGAVVTTERIHELTNYLQSIQK